MSSQCRPSVHPPGGPTLAAERERQARSQEARERVRSWQDHLLDALVGARVIEPNFPARDADAVAADALRHLFADWQPPDGRPLVERAAEQAVEHVEALLPALIEHAVSKALAEGDE